MSFLRKFTHTSALILVSFQIFAQAIPPVPKRITMFDLQINMEDDVRRTIEKEMAFLAAKRPYVEAKLAKMAVYFPVIESVFREKGVPLAFKYLCAQESSFIADAVSSSNAVGFWQFKAGTATDYGLRVDEYIDERKHIVAATHAAADYLLKNNSIYKNWIATLLSYRLGLTGAKSQIPASYYNASEITITSAMDWYVIRNIAHYIYFENELEQYRPNGHYLYLYPRANGRSFDQIAQELGILTADLKKENLWCTTDIIPNDKEYTVTTILKPSQNVVIASETNGTMINKPFFDIEVGYPVLIKNEKKSKKTGNVYYTINGKEGILAQKGDTPSKLAERSALKKDYLLSYNDIDEQTAIQPNMVYYLERKNRINKNAEFHTVKKGQTVWLVSQMYGIKKKRLLRLNRMKKDEALQVGRVLHLSKRIKRNSKVDITPQILEKEPVPYDSQPVLVVNNNKTIPQKTEESNTSKVFSESETEKETSKEANTTSYNNQPERKIVVRDVSPYSKPTPTGNSDIVYTKPSKAVLKANEHEVLAGETLFAIARKYNTTPTDIKLWNNKTDNHLKVGEVLIVKANNITTTTTTSKTYNSALTHTVKSGETLYRISVNYGLSVEKLKQYNNLTDNTIEVGQVLIVSR